VSEASRHRYLFLRNRLEELFSKYGLPDLPPPMGAEAEPTWGPLGSLARKAWGDDAVDALLALDREMARTARPNAQEQASPPEPVQPEAEEEAPQNRVPEASTPEPSDKGPRGPGW
jgi:hypothetical protein